MLKARSSDLSARLHETHLFSSARMPEEEDDQGQHEEWNDDRPDSKAPSPTWPSLNVACHRAADKSGNEIGRCCNRQHHWSHGKRRCVGNEHGNAVTHTLSANRVSQVSRRHFRWVTTEPDFCPKTDLPNRCKDVGRSIGLDSLCGSSEDVANNPDQQTDGHTLRATPQVHGFG